MSLKKSEQPHAFDPAAGRTDHFAGRGALGAGFSPWARTLLANGPLPVLLVAIALLGFLLDRSNVDPYYFRIVMLIGFNIILAVSLQLINGFSGQFSLGHAGFMAVGAYMAAFPALNFSERFTNSAAPLWFFISLGIVAAILGGALYGLFWLIQLSRKLHSSLPAVAILLVFAWLLVDISMESRSYAGSWALLWSRAFDLISRLFAWLIESGAPPANRLALSIPEIAREPICFLILIIGAGCCAAVAGFVVGLPALRLRGDYLAIATLGMAEIIRIVIQNSPPLGGALGLTNIPKYTSFAWLYGIAVITIFVIWRVAYSSQGRAIVAVREDEIAASACGISTTGRKVTAFVIGAFFAGVAGALFSLHERNITPGYFNMTKSIEAVVMVTLGGLGSISGAILAAAVLTILPELLRDPPILGIAGWILVIIICAIVVVVAMYRRKPWLAPVLTILIACGAWEIIRAIALWRDVKLADFRMIIYSLSLILMMLLRPQGLLGGRELWPKRLGNSGRLPTPTEDRQNPEPTVTA
ncbi:hypothetical protein BH09PLA1_BH09PLA1_12150 [soil metagenome]